MSRGRGKKPVRFGGSKHRKARVQRFAKKNPKSRKVAKL